MGAHELLRVLAGIPFPAVRQEILRGAINAMAPLYEVQILDKVELNETDGDEEASRVFASNLTPQIAQKILEKESPLRPDQITLINDIIISLDALRSLNPLNDQISVCATVSSSYEVLIAKVMPDSATFVWSGLTVSVNPESLKTALEQAK